MILAYEKAIEKARLNGSFQVAESLQDVLDALQGGDFVIAVVLAHIHNFKMDSIESLMRVFKVGRVD